VSDKLRLFVAADIPELHLDWVQNEIAPWRESVSGARWTEPRNQHLTLKFLGWADSEKRDDIEAACAKVAASHRSSTLRLTLPGAFPNPRRARVLWVGIDDPAGLLAALATDLDRAFESLGFEAEKRAFTAHLTLARFKVPARLELPELDARQLGEFEVDSIGLWRSHLARAGAEYELLERWPLNG
jgi:2'-5' RNA ligase